MGYGSCKLDVTHSFATNLLLSYLNSALFADLTLVANTLVLSAKTFPVLSRTKDLFAEKSVAFSLEGTVIYSFGLLDFAL